MTACRSKELQMQELILNQTIDYVLVTDKVI